MFTNSNLGRSISLINSNYQVAGITSLGNIFAAVINILLGVTFGLSIIGIAYAFFQYIISRGDKDLVGKAKTALTWSVVGLLIAFLVVAFKNILFKLLGVAGEYDNTTPEF